MLSTLVSLIAAAESGDAAKELLFSELYAELHRLAKRELARRGELLRLLQRIETVTATPPPCRTERDKDEHPGATFCSGDWLE